MRNGPTFSKPTQSTGAAAAAAPAKKLTASQRREARVKEIREQYLAGTYKVDAAELSRKIVDSHLTK
jgi:anti-sigma28 factor (negative regulator of flagellin synthesis)